MIVTVCLNPALDVTYHVPKLVHGTAHSIAEMFVRPGGKASNVARVLAQLGEPVTLIAPVGGPSGAAFTSALTGVLSPAQFVAVETAAAIRTCVTVVDHDATVFNEPGPQLQPQVWDDVVGAVATTTAADDVVVLSGSVPPGVPDDAYAQLVEVAHGAGARVVLDAKGSALAAGLDAGPDVAAPNVAEAADVLGTSDPATCAALLLSAGADAAVVSAGARGLFAQHGSRRWHAVPPRLVEGNPTGAGDAVTAALAIGLSHDRPWHDIVADCVAFGAAAVAARVAGEIDVELCHELRRSVVVEES